MKINRSVFIHGFNLGYFLGTYELFNNTSNKDLIDYGMKGVVLEINAFSSDKMDINIDYGNSFSKNATDRYVDAFHREDNIVDFLYIGYVFSALRLNKIFNTRQNDDVGTSLEQDYLKLVSRKVVFRRKKFLEFMDYLYEASHELNITDIDIIASAVHLYLTNSFDKNEDCYSFLMKYAENDEEEDCVDEEDDWSSVSDESNLSDKYVFISYSSKNQKSADLINETLNGFAIRTWIATKDIPAGMEYPAVISDAIENSACVLLILSNEAQQSRYVMSEIRLAYDSNIPIVCMNIDNCQLVSGFKLLLGTQHIVSVNSSDDIGKIFSAIESYIK